MGKREGQALHRQVDIHVFCGHLIASSSFRQPIPLSPPLIWSLNLYVDTRPLLVVQRLTKKLYICAYNHLIT